MKFPAPLAGLCGNCRTAPAPAFLADYGRRASVRRAAAPGDRLARIFAMRRGSAFLARRRAPRRRRPLRLMAWRRYSAFVAAEGGVPDYFARVVGRRLRDGDDLGRRELTRQGNHRGHRNWPRRIRCPFSTSQKVRARLIFRCRWSRTRASASSIQAGVVIEIEERQPFALWQQDGVVKIVAADGTPIDTYTIGALPTLPLVVGTGANARLGEYIGAARCGRRSAPRSRPAFLSPSVAGP